MIKKSIVFAAFDEEYVATIEFKLAKLTEERASIEFITDAGCLEAFLERPKKIDVLILPYGIAGLCSDSGRWHSKIFFCKIYDRRRDGCRESCLHI